MYFHLACNLSTALPTGSSLIFVRFILRSFYDNSLMHQLQTFTQGKNSIKDYGTSQSQNSKINYFAFFTSVQIRIQSQKNVLSLEKLIIWKVTGQNLNKSHDLWHCQIINCHAKFFQQKDHCHEKCCTNTVTTLSSAMSAELCVEAMQVNRRGGKFAPLKDRCLVAQYVGYTLASAPTPAQTNCPIHNSQL